MGIRDDAFPSNAIIGLLVLALVILAAVRPNPAGMEEQSAQTREVRAAS